MSGFAALNGEPDGPPLLPPIALTDEVTALAAAFATMVALHSGVGQVVDVNLLESLFQIMGPLMSAYRVLGYQQPRSGSGIPYSVPRGTYQCADGPWVAVSTSAETVAQRVMALIGVGDDARFTTFEGRIAHRDEVDRLMSEWIGARTEAEVLAAFEDGARGDRADPRHGRHRARSALRRAGVDHRGRRHPDARPHRPTVGDTRAVRWAGRALGADTAEIVSELE